MDSLQGIDEGSDRDAQPEAMTAISTDERRMHVRAYNAWVSLLRGRPLPSIADLDPAAAGDFGPHSVLLDFVEDPDDPRVGWLGADLRAQCGTDGEIRTIADVPRGSLLSRLTDHRLQIIANRAPIGFEAEFTNGDGILTLYRGILLPFTSDGTTIDFIYGVINWKQMAPAGHVAAPAYDPPPSLPSPQSTPPRPMPAGPVWADGPNAGPAMRGLSRPVPSGYGAQDEPDGEDDGDNGDDEGAALNEEALAFDDGLADQLAAARETAELVHSAEGRNRNFLYRALGLAYDFSLATEYREKEYLDLLEDAGIRLLPRAPMAALVKLIFGTGCDRVRVTDFSAALAYARRLGVEPGGFATMIERHPGGLKGVVLEERKARRPVTQRDRSEIARAALRKADAQAVIRMAAGEGEFVLLVARREADGSLAVIAPVPEDAQLLDRAVRRITS
ncbi:PAS domain-containing protein [Flavisphingomonas formosensis]|uniref:PAS domain-containing protein n=1 Tax=Flavisphingomonas formosensis TaxID=861534 RepID=UPI0012F8BF0C|nr:hypothetical protein [Sphingomonas formosensis]